MNNLKIGAKLFLSFGAVVLLLLTMTGFVLYSYSNISQSSDDVQGMFGSSTRAADCVIRANEARRNFLRYLLSPSENYNRGFDDEMNRVKETISEVAEQSPIPENQTEARALLPLLTRIENAKKRFVDAGAPIVTVRAECNAISTRVRQNLEKAAEDLAEHAEQQESTEAAHDLIVLEGKVFNAIALVHQILRARDVFVFSSDEALHSEYKPLLVNGLRNLKDQLDEVGNCPTLPQGAIAALVRTVITDRNTWETIANRYVTLVEERRAMEEPILTDLRAVMAGVTKIQDNVTKVAESTGADQHRVIDNARWLSVSIAVAVVIISVLLGWRLTVSVAGGVKIAVGAMKMIADEGDVAIEIPEKDLARGDEVGQLAHAVQGILKQFQNVEHLANELADGNYDAETKVRSDKDTMNIYLNKMLDQVNEAMREINESVKQVATGSGEVSSAAQSLSSGAQESAASLEQITASMSEISSQVKTNAENAAQARDLAQNANKSAAEGQKAMMDMTGAMSQITQNSHEIQRVIKVIDDIAFQTNLLALNAAVEAARAGQHGKGFAVVAEEVRNLASRSAKAAKETSDLIAKSGQEIEKGGEVSARTAEVLNSIVEEIKKTTDLVAGIAVASNEQAHGVNQITIGLQQIDQVTQQNTAAAEESASAANEMSAMAGTLQRLLARFKLRGQSGIGRSGGGRSLSMESAPVRPAASSAKASTPSVSASAPVSSPSPLPKPAVKAPSSVPKPVSSGLKSDPSEPVSGHGWGGGGTADIRIDLDAKDFGKY